MKKKYIYLLVIAAMTTFAKKKEDKKLPKIITPKMFDDVILNWNSTFGETLHIVKNKHYRVRDPEKIMINAINGALTSLDPHSSFLDPKTYKTILEMTSGEFFGIGIVIDNTRKPKDKFLLIIDTVPGGPSDKAGIKPHDKIIEIDGKILDGMTTEEATAKLRGERKTKIHIKVLRHDKEKPLKFEIERDIVKEQTSLAFNIQGYNIAYLSLTSFTNTAAQQLEALIKKSKQKNYKGLILDLRNNSGGLLSSVIDICGLFLPKNSLVVTTRDKTNKNTEKYETNRKPIANKKLPIFILINNYTASAAEILAGCLQIHSEKLDSKNKNHPMVFLVGSKTFGKGSVQEIIPVSNNSAIKLTTSLYYLPNNKTIQGKGITPDFAVEKQFPETEQVIWFKKFYGSEHALNNTLIAYDEKPKEEDKKEKSKENDVTKKWSERVEKMLQTDNQFLSAVTLINIFDTAQTKCPANISTRKDAINYLENMFALNKKLEIEEIKI